MDLYREIILDHYKNPHNFGHLDKPTAKAEENNVSCGDKIIMEIKIGNKNNITDVKFTGEGCAICIASASLLTDYAEQKSLGAVMKLSLKDISAMLGTTLTPSRVKCAMLPLEVLQKAVLKCKT